MLDIKLTRTTSPKAKPADESKLGFGKHFSDHMFLMDYTAGEFFSMLPDEFRASPAGGSTTRLSAPRGKRGSTIRLFAGTDDPLVVASTLDNALRN